jgi:hypothetical protein
MVEVAILGTVWQQEEGSFHGGKEATPKCPLPANPMP